MVPAVFAWRVRLGWVDWVIDFDSRGESGGCLEQKAAVGELAVAARPGDEIDAVRLAGEGLVDVVLAVADHHDGGGVCEAASRGLRRFDPAHGFLVFQATLLAGRLHLCRWAGPNLPPRPAHHRFIVSVHCP